MTEVTEELVIKYRNLIRRCIDQHLYETALFWADKVAVSTNAIKDIYWLAQCMYLVGQYHRAVHLLESKCTDKRYIQCRFLIIKCHYDAKQYNEALEAIKTSLNNEKDSIVFDDTPKNQIMSALYLLKGKVLECSDNIKLATDCYKQALFYDVYCFEALHRLTNNQMLSANEEKELLHFISLPDQIPDREAALVRKLYSRRLKKYHTSIAIPSDTSKFTPMLPNDKNPKNINFATILSKNVSNTSSVQPTPTVLNSTPITESMQIDDEPTTATPATVVKTVKTISFAENSLDFQVEKVELLYYNCDYVSAISLAEEILNEDPFHEQCLPVYVACLVELKESVKLFTLAHKLVQIYPKLAISWYAVGCYYNITGKIELARKYLAQASCLDRFNGAVWLAYGHSFASQKEHDQAMAAYFKASQLMKGFHLPLLYIGLECGLTNNAPLAEKFFNQARSIAPDDPFLMHERGVVCFQNQQYTMAEINFRNALKIIKQIKKERPIIPNMWVSLLNNLGHTCRKLKKFEEALHFHSEALLIEPQSHSIFSSIAYVHALTENYEEAIDWFHKALSLKSDDMFSTTMLNYVIEHWTEATTPFPGCPIDIPKFESKRNKTVDSCSSMDIVSRESINESL